jgi:hypothetical protein
MKPIVNITASIVATALVAALAAPAGAAEPTRAVVLGVHNEQATAPVVKALHLSHDPAKGGRFAVVQLRQGAYGNGSYALVYVPNGVTVAKNDVVELTPAEMDLWTNPGKGVVTRSRSDLALNR